MGEVWLWNFTQVPGLVNSKFMTEDDMRDIPYPATELGIHIAYKNVEAGSLIGGFIVAPLWTYIRKTGDLAKTKLRFRMGICGRRGMLLGLLLTPPLEYFFIKGKKVEEDGLKDRCYRLRYNKKQLFSDRAVTVFAPLGWLAMRWPGVVMGTNFAVLGGAIINATVFDHLRKRSLLKDEMEKPDPHYKPKKL